MTQSIRLSTSESATIKAALVLQAAAFDARADLQASAVDRLHDRARAAELLALANRFLATPRP